MLGRRFSTFVFLQVSLQNTRNNSQVFDHSLKGEMSTNQNIFWGTTWCRRPMKASRKQPCWSCELISLYKALLHSLTYNGHQFRWTFPTKMKGLRWPSNAKSTMVLESGIDELITSFLYNHSVVQSFNPMNIVGSAWPWATISDFLRVVISERCKEHTRYRRSCSDIHDSQSLYWVWI